MLQKFKLEDAKTVAIPADPNVVLCKNDGSESVDQKNYQSIIGSLLYAVLATRPDQTFNSQWELVLVTIRAPPKHTLQPQKELFAI